MTIWICFSKSTAAAAWAGITAVKAGTRLAAEEALAAGWLEERRHVDATDWMSMVEVYQSALRSWQTVYSQKG